MARYTKKLEFSPRQRAAIKERDGGCIFCKIGYRMEGALSFDLEIMSIMHYVPRSGLGLGIEENGAVGCQYHHNMLDNGSGGHRKEMLGIFENYLRGIYPDWDVSRLRYDKWRKE